MKKLFFIFTTLISFGVSAGEIYTCTINGKTIYQGKPCPGSKALTEKVSQAKANEQAKELAKYRYEVEMREMSLRKEPSIGMTTNQVGKSTWGYPKSYSETQSLNGLSEFWHYESGRMIYFKNGKVVSITK
ncbi:DUF4124 domain-containing protein [Acinetobacter sp. ANC 4862]|uniref:DUF4124 domain-containing protein n=1 Tax=Acinetobacter sp. ANC 4862 TaxID=2529849 RepID=UPI001038FD25|nr:DUF4124 domain-containing protein [Acinetobacter sp. ANC 4862]TCH64202.1 hypothetical protein E0409_06420 [Acinetobacter sp. ANC 4862]